MIRLLHFSKRKNNKSGIPMLMQIRVLSKAICISIKVKRPLSLVICVLGFVVAFIPTIISSLTKEFTNHIQSGDYRHETIVQSAIILLIIILLYIISELYTVAENYFKDIDRLAVNSYIEESIMKICKSVQFRFLDNDKGFMDKVAFSENGGANRVAMSINLTIAFLHAIIAFISVTIALANINVWIIVVMIVACIPSIVVSRNLNGENYRNSTKKMKELRMANRIYSITNGMVYQGRARFTVRYSNAHNWLKKKWRTIADEVIEKKKKTYTKYIKWNLFSDFLRNGSLAFALYTSIHRIKTYPLLGLGLFVSTYLLSKQFLSITSKLVASSTSIMGDIPYIKDYLDLYNYEKECEYNDSIVTGKASIDFINVSFKYPNSSTDALHDISVTIKQGEKVAIVGKNGSGKSTFVNLLCGVYSPTNGKVVISGLEVDKHLKAVRQIISVVFQNFGHYETSLRENISVGDITRNVPDSEINNLISLIGMDEITNKLKNGLNEEIGSFSHSGQDFSGGQWQKIALARALIRKKSRIIILDEPTAALDPISEAKLYHDFSKLTGDKTTILISHRLGITSVVDRVLVFDKGRIVEDGSHDELIKKGGIYKKLYNSQAIWYK